MTWLRSLARPAWTDAEELMDGPEATRAEKAGALRDLSRANRLTLGHALTLRAFTSLTEGMEVGEKLSVLDVATGGADFPREISRWALRSGYRPEVLATDRDPRMLEIAREHEVGGGAIRYEVANALELPYADDGFDIASCSLFLHHLSPDNAARLLAELSRVSRRGVVVNDLIRSWAGYVGTLTFTRIASRNRLFRYDGPLSVRKSYTRREMLALAERAGLPEPRFQTIPGYRLVMWFPNPAALRSGERERAHDPR